jgi:hypothetical protein
MFTFNPDGGKDIQVLPGSKQYSINGQQCQWSKPPAVEDEEICGSFSELAELLGCDSNLLAANGGPSNSPEKMEIWS